MCQYPIDWWVLETNNFNWQRSYALNVWKDCAFQQMIDGSVKDQKNSFPNWVEKFSVLWLRNIRFCFEMDISLEYSKSYLIVYR